MSYERRDEGLRTQAAECLAERMRGVVGSNDFVTIDLACTYMQFQGLVAPKGEGLLLELPSNNCLPKKFALSADHEAALIGMGFAAPEDDLLPNFFMVFAHGEGLEEDRADDPLELLAGPDEFDAALGAAALKAVAALIDVYGFGAAYIAGVMGATRRRSGGAMGRSRGPAGRGASAAPDWPDWIPGSALSCPRPAVRPIRHGSSPRSIGGIPTRCGACRRWHRAAPRTRH